MAKLKHRLILALAAVFSMAGVLSLLTSPALAAMPDAKCEAWALEIKGRTKDIEDDTENFDPLHLSNTFGCKNLCEGVELRNLDGTRFLRSTSGLLAAAIIDIVDTPGDRSFSTGLYGTIAFFCAKDQTKYPNKWTDVVVGVQNPDASACGTEYRPICDAPISPISIE